jgi:hypothetical protein
MSGKIYACNYQAHQQQSLTLLTFGGISSLIDDVNNYSMEHKPISLSSLSYLNQEEWRMDLSSAVYMYSNEWESL